MRITHAFRLGLFGGLGVMLAIGIAGAFTSLATILIWVGAALFLALGLDPLVSYLEGKSWPRWLAILTVLVGVLGAFTGLIFALIPAITPQVAKIFSSGGDLDSAARAFAQWVHNAVPWIDASAVLDQVDRVLEGLDVASVGGGILAAGIGLANAAFGALVVLILTLYFVASLSNIKRSFYQLVPASKREGFIDIAEQISTAVGRYVMGQGSLALVNGALSFLVLTFIFRVDNATLLAFIALLGSIVPLVGTLTASVLITGSVFLFHGAGWQVVAVGIYYLVYMQVEAYLISPRIMKQAVQIPGVVVVIAALAGGTLLGVLGALVAIPMAAAVILVVKQVLIPRQDAA